MGFLERGRFYTDSVSGEIRADLEGLLKLNAAFEIANRISGNGDVFLYGGQVRELVIGTRTTSSDYDFIGDFNLEKIQTTFPEKVKGIWPEVSTLRSNFGGLVFDITAASNVEEHLAKCDITLSTMYMSWDGQIHDSFGALSDIENRVIRIEDADRKIKADPARILRVFRFAADLEFNIDPNTLEAVIKNAGLFESADFWSEWQKLLALQEEKTNCI